MTAGSFGAGPDQSGPNAQPGMPPPPPGYSPPGYQPPPPGYQHAPYPQGGQFQPVSPQFQLDFAVRPRPTNGLAIAALSCGIGQLVAGPLSGVPAIVLGAMSLRQIRDTGEDGRAMAVTGLVLGIVGTVLFVLGIVLFVVFAAFAIHLAHTPPSPAT
jgi:hypothetical protein